MSRIDENENMIRSTKTTFHGKTDDVLCQIKGQELGILADISKSLAIIADCCLDEWQKSNTSWDVSWNNKEERNEGNTER